MQTRIKYKKQEALATSSASCRILRGSFGWIVRAQNRTIGEVEFLADAEALAAREDARILAQSAAREAADREALAESAARDTVASILADDADAYDVRNGRGEQ
jgi:hypothetical protein